MINFIKNRVLRWAKAFGYSLSGFVECFKTERAFQEEVIAFILAIPIAIVIPVTIVEKLYLISSILLIIIIELINSGIEAVVDRVSTEHHALSKKAKDVCSCAVLFCLIHAVIVWGVIVGQLLIT